MKKLIEWFIRNQDLLKRILQMLLNILTAAATALATSCTFGQV